VKTGYFCAVRHIFAEIFQRSFALRWPSGWFGEKKARADARAFLISAAPKRKGPPGEPAQLIGRPRGNTWRRWQW
jgi:hypothetical protein